MRILRSLAVAAFATALTGTSAIAASAHEAPDVTVIDGIAVEVDGVDTRAELDAFVLSDAPKTLTVEAETGELTSVSEGLSTVPAGRISTKNICSAADACLVSGQAPLASFGFTGKGTASGSWPSRISFKTGSNTAQAWYSHNGATVQWGPKAGPGSEIRMDRLVTGVRVTIS